MDKHYDYVILGSGPAGHISAIRASQLGLKALLVEKDRTMLGGVCLNEGCIPAKSLYHSAEVINNVRTAGTLMDVSVPCKFNVDLEKMLAKCRNDVSQLTDGLSYLLKKNNVDLVFGSGRFINNGQVEILTDGSDKIPVTADSFLVATGSSPKSIPGINFNGKTVLSSADVLRLKSLPSNILIVGGGAIGVEFASYFSQLEVAVTLVEYEDNLLPEWDTDISRAMASAMKRSGVEVITSASIKGIVCSRKTAETTIETKNGSMVRGFEKVIIATGRAPNTGGVGLEEAGVRLDNNGFITVDPSMRTSVGNIYAAGDVIASPMLAHTASAEGEVAARSVTGDKFCSIDYNAVPNVVYSRIKAAAVGRTEKNLNGTDVTYMKGKLFFKSNGRAVAESGTEGFVSVLADKKTHKILGASLVGVRADEIIHEFILAMQTGLSVEDLAGTVHAHPTFSEIVSDVCKSMVE